MDLDCHAASIMAKTDDQIGRVWDRLTSPVFSKP